MRRTSLLTAPFVLVLPLAPACYVAEPVLFPLPDGGTPSDGGTPPDDGSGVSVHYRSIGTLETPLLEQGTATIAAGTTEVRFTDALPSNVGLGDALELDGEVLHVFARTNATTVITERPATAGHVGSPFSLGRAYHSLQAWVDDRGGDLVADGRREVGVVYNDGPLTSGVTFARATTDSAHFMHLTVAAGHRHRGLAGTGVVLDGQDGPDNEIKIDEVSHTRVSGLELARHRGDDKHAAVEVKAADVLLEDLLIHDFVDPQHTVSGIRISGNGGHSVTVRNTIIYDGDEYGIEGDDSSDVVRVQNCTIYGMDGVGVSETDNVSRFEVANTIIVASGDGDFDIPNGEQRHNISSDDTATGSGSRTAVIAEEQFLSVVAGSEDLHLQETSIAVDLGMDLSADFATDVDAQPRPHGAAWDVGADEH